MAEMTITEQIVNIKEEVCKYACKYKEKAVDDVVGRSWLYGYCHSCPLERLHYDNKVCAGAVADNRGHGDIQR